MENAGAQPRRRMADDDTTPDAWVPLLTVCRRQDARRWHPAYLAWQDQNSPVQELVGVTR